MSASGSAPRPRLCHVKKWSDFNGYGFNLHAEKGKAGQFIGKVDPGSPSEAAGLKQGDRIIEVNGTNIGNENHQQVVQRVKAVPNETKLLVVDSEADEYFKAEKIVIRGDMTNIETIEAPDEKGGTVSTTSNDPSNDIDADAPCPRECHLKIWPDFQGYGFNLHAEKGKPGQFIGKVDAGSPADVAGLKQGDRIIEVNGDNIAQDNHGQVVQRIKARSNETSMLVVDEEAENYYKSKNIAIANSLPNTKVIRCGDSAADSATAKPPAPVPVTADEPVAAAAESSEEQAPVPRLCHLRIRPDFQGYGFNLHADKGQGGQHIGKVDAGSPAEDAGLKQGDKIVEVNDELVMQESHQTVVTAIKSKPGETVLLVVDDETYNYYKNKGITINSSLLKSTENGEAPLVNGSASQVEAEVNHTAAAAQEEEVSPPESEPEEPAIVNDVKSEPEVDMNENESKEPEPENQPPVYENQADENDTGLEDYETFEGENTVTSTKTEETMSPTYENPPEEKTEDSPAPVEVQTTPTYDDIEVRPTASPPRAEHIYEEPSKLDDAIKSEPPTPTTPESPKSPVVIAGIEFAPSAKEAREKMAKRNSKKHGVKVQEGQSMRDKYELFQKL